MGRRNTISSLHVLMDAVLEVFESEVAQFKKDSKKRTHKLREKVQDFQTLLSVSSFSH